MGWLYGIPDVSLANHFVYFNNLLDTSFNVTSRKYIVGKTAQNLFVAGIGQLQNANAEIQAAIKFIQQVATNEREKEVAAVRAFCMKNKNEYPFLNDILNEDIMLNNPEEFYLKLTATLNQARLSTKNYITELKRIKHNAEGAKTKLSDYFTDDARYRLAGDATSLLKKLIGNYQFDKNTDDTYNQKLHEIVIDILNETVTKKMQKGENFAAIGVAVLADIESRAQAILDSHPELNDFTDLSNELLQELKKSYLKEIKEKQSKEQSVIQQALNEYGGNNFKRIIRNVKDIFGITTLDLQSAEYQKQLASIQQQVQRRDNYEIKQNQLISNIKTKIKSTTLKNNLQQITFTKLDYNTRHGNVQELVKSFIEENGLTVGSKGAATDVLSILCDYEIKPNNKILNTVLEEIGQEFNNIYLNDEAANNRDMRNSIKIMNENIDVIIGKLEEKLNTINNNNLGEFFIFHESLKLYSSIETGVGKKFGQNGFGGRNMNIISYIDFMLSATEAAGISTPATRDLLIFLSLNLSDLAVGRGNTSPLEKYFSIFAGLLMFDDVCNMTLEATEQMPSSSIKQVHLYNLNGIYVPASMVLSYVSDALQLGAQEASYAATATINYNKASSAIDKWKNPEHLLPEHWQQMGKAVASGTKVKIAFMSAFLDFINKLSDL